MGQIVETTSCKGKILSLVSTTALGMPFGQTGFKVPCEFLMSLLIVAGRYPEDLSVVCWHDSSHPSRGYPCEGEVEDGISDIVKEAMLQ